jgi:glycosyltransferase involved in cell wall biosynthesis
MAHIVMVLIGDIRYDGRVRKEIRTLVGHGHRIELVVSDFGTNCGTGQDLGIKIYPIPMTLWSNPAMNFLAQIRFNQIAASIISQLAPSHIHCHDLNSLLAGTWAKHKTGAKLVFDAHELMPESLGGFKKTVWDRIEKRCVDDCDYIIMPEKNRIAYFKDKYPGIEHVLLLENFPSRTDIPDQSYDLFRQLYPIVKGQKIILYTGLIAARRHVEELVESMTLCSDQFVLVLLGTTFRGYKEILRAKIKTLGVQDRVYLQAPVPHAEILRYMASCDIGTAFYRNTQVNNYYCASNKIYEYIALNKVVLTNDYPGLLETVGKNRQGLCLTEVTAKSLQEAYTRASDPTLVTPGRKKLLWEDQQHVLRQLYRA